MLLSLLLVACTPVVVVVLASRYTAAPRTATERPASTDLRAPSAPFFVGEGDGVRPNGIGCQRRDGTALRARAHLDVFADGAAVKVPASIGVLADCRYWLHTRDDDGTVEIRSPERRTFRIGDLFDIWGAPLSRERVLGFALGGRRKLRAYVDGRLITGDPRRIALRDGREIALVIGRRPAELPRSLTFR